MPNDLRPWFTENVLPLIRGLYFSTRPNIVNRERWIGYLLAWSSVILAMGGNPETFMAPDDVQLIKYEMNRK